ncbi:lipid-A-disaccharide synthase [Thermaurantimonas aggregans]|uniref:Lipid-A-disaccharide synthase n=1 Tax=Thermaurantimonas aggregans TaxID=2173829 RepID=A0A401XIS8_9FLAO|nr:lipid-A-disaccharide synthase [Thermaurantimonas aggregans]MCX8148841.1 lipid-A-disaccharide synthase [Thermaurantimonas aggregans]GCD76898.1 lipid-A-disaccharide synthase [Thermaurantimonas aggregans]
MKFLLLAGESSGDLHGANLLKNLKKLYPDSTFYCFGGNKMVNEGGILLLHYREMAFMGFYEVIKNLRKILKNLEFCKNWILKNKPDVIVYIDFPGFNMRIAKFAKEKGFKNIYYISPQIWAWKEGRVHQIKRDIDLMITILPFEKNFYEKYGYKVEYVGHPLLDAIDISSTENLLENQIEFDIALLPGSRKQEIENILPAMTEFAVKNIHLKFGLAAAPSIEKSLYEKYTSRTNNIKIIEGKTYEVIRSSRAAIVASGTATLETALLNTPLIVVYKGSKLSYLIAKKLVKVKYISLVNLILDKKAVPELIQDDLTTENLEKEIRKLLEEGSAVKAQRSAFAELRNKLGGKGASERAAFCIKNFLENEEVV